MFRIIVQNFHIEKILWILKNKLKVMVLAGLVGAVLLGVYAGVTQTSLYQARISFYVYSNIDYVSDTGASLNVAEATQARVLLDSYMQIIKSNTFLNSVIEELDLENQMSTEMLKKSIHSGSVSNTAVFYVAVDNEDPMLAMNIANMIGELAPKKVIGIVKSGGIEVLDPAELPILPYEETSVVKYVAGGFVLGFGLACVLCMLQGLTNTTVRRKYEIEDLFTIPVLGDVPELKGKKNEKPTVILTNESPFAFREAYSNVRANLLFTARGEKCPVYAVTSADPNEGKTITTLNMAITYANLGKKVLVIDADMRNSVLAENLGIDLSKETGLSQYLAGITSEVNIKSFQDKVDIFYSGEVPPNPSELIANEKFKVFLNECKEKYDAVFIDLPPLGLISDALLIVDQVVAYILVVRENVTRFDREENIVRMIEKVDGNICGFIYNGISPKSPDYHYKDMGKYGKDYYYGKEYQN